MFPQRLPGTVRNETPPGTCSSTVMCQRDSFQRPSTEPTCLPVASSYMTDAQETPTEPASPPVASSEMGRTQARTTQPANPPSFRPTVLTADESCNHSASPSVGSSHMVSTQDASLQNNTTSNPAPTMETGNSSSNNSSSTGRNPAAPPFIPQTAFAPPQISTAPATHHGGIPRLNITFPMALKVLDRYQENFKKLEAKIQALEREVAVLRATEQVNNEDVIQELERQLAALRATEHVNNEDINQEKEAEIESHKRCIGLLLRIVESQDSNLERLEDIFGLQENEIASLKDSIAPLKDEIAEASWTIEVHKMKEARRRREQRDLGPVGSKLKSDKEIEKLKEEVANLKARNKELTSSLEKEALYEENKKLKKEMAQRKYTANLAVNRSSELITEAEEKCEQELAVLKGKIEDLEFQNQKLTTSGPKEKFDPHHLKGKPQDEGVQSSDEARASESGAPVVANMNEVVAAASTDGQSQTPSQPTSS